MITMDTFRELDVTNFNTVMNEIYAMRRKYDVTDSVINLRRHDGLDYIENQFVKHYMSYKEPDNMRLEVFNAWLFVKNYKILIEIMNSSKDDVSMITHIVVKYLCDEIFFRLCAE